MSGERAADDRGGATERIVIACERENNGERVKSSWKIATIAGFNLLPAFPMDGGRVLRAWLAMRMNYLQATRIAGGIGQAMAWVLGFIGLMTNPILVFVALFIWIGAEQEVAGAQADWALTGVPVERVMIREFHTLAPDDHLARAVDYALSGYQHDFPVVDGGRPIGALTRSDLLTGLSREGEEALVRAYMQSRYCAAESTESLEVMLRRLQEAGARTLLVERNGELVGILNAENLGEYLMFQAALERSQSRQPPTRGVMPPKLATAAAPAK